MSEVKKYGTTEEEEWAHESIKSRQIVAEILNFGVSQRQIYNIAYLLSLELENREAMINISSCIKEHMSGAGNTSTGIIT